MRVAVEIEEIELQGDFGPIDSVCARCTRCGHETESFGISEASIRRCLAILREECPEDEQNFYTADD